MLKIGSTGIGSIYLGSQKIVRAYLGSTIVFDKTTPPVPSFTITASADPEGGGTVSGAGTYQLGESVTVTAVSADGYEFLGWQENGVTVSESEGYTFTVSGDRELVAVFEEIAESVLPAGDTELEYIYQESEYESTAAWFKLPAITSATKCTLKLSFLSESSGRTSTAVFCGTLTYSSSKLSSISGLTGGYTTNGKYLALFNSSTSPTVSWDKLELLPTTHELTLDYTNKQIILDGSAVSKSPGTWFRKALPMFRGERSGSGSPTVYSHVALYRAVWENDAGEILRELIPCRKADGTVCMYDSVGKIYYTNQSASSSSPGFTAGPAV